ncbi:MAG: metal-dependent hydrolase, partial [Thaumarchaeota archaeon]|nr:metal-dependent hydrolase [Nitrososphaerota archaeon]
MDLPTHFAFGLAMGLVFFGHQPELALLIALGALLPDLDREYWFIPAKQYAEEQRHRALLHNVVVIALTYVVSPFLSLGVFLHILQDSFTTVKDRGVEWFYPLLGSLRGGATTQTEKSSPWIRILLPRGSPRSCEIRGRRPAGDYEGVGSLETSVRVCPEQPPPGSRIPLRINSSYRSVAFCSHRESNIPEFEHDDSCSNSCVRDLVP